MLRSGLDRAFVRYARTGDPGALAKVFDGTAAELYRLGYHLLGDRHAAEDLVQHTFVVAIEQSKGFDGSRRVLPWLCGILTNRALHQRRQARQRAAAGEGRDAAERAIDPAAEAGAREAEAVVAAAVRSLDEPYRQVLLLHLVHELQPKDIAEALARPDATVRTQLARGLELLRKALPLGIAGLAAGQVPPPQLGAVRAAVMARAAQVAATAGAGAAAVIAFTGVVAMKKVLLVLAAVLAAVLAWPWLAPSEPMPVVTADASTSPPVPAVAQTPAAPRSDLASADERVEVRAAHDASTASLEVRVSWSDGTPAADVPVRVRPRPFDVETWLRVVRTGDDGVARFAKLPPGTANALTNRGAATDVELAAGVAMRAEITLSAGLDVRGRVVNLDGLSIAGATVWMSVVPNSDDGEPVATSAFDGSFTIRAAGIEHVVIATAPGYGCARATFATRGDLVLTLRPAPGVLAGIVVGADGRPIAGARVLLGIATSSTATGVHSRFFGEITGQDLWPSRFLRTDDEGRFRTEGLPALRWPLWVGAPGFAPVFREVEVRAEALTEVTIQLTQGGTVRGCVTDAAGTEIAGASISAIADLPAPHPLVGLGMKQLTSPPLWARARAVSDEQGRYCIERVMFGKLELIAGAKGSHVRSECDLAVAQTHEWNPVLAPERLDGEPLHGMLVGEDGEPLQHWTVRVGKPGDAANQHRLHVAENGAFRSARLPAGRHRVVATPRDPQIGFAFDAGEFESAQCPLRIVVPRAHVPAARLRGRIVAPTTAPDARCYVWLLTGDREAWLRVPCEPDGTYDVGPVAPGRYTMRAESRAFGHVPVGVIEVPDHRDVDAGEFRVPAPGTLVVTLVDARGVRQPDAWVTARAAGAPGAAAELQHREGIARGNVVPGRWRISSQDRTPLAALDVDVRAGETTDVRFVVPDSVRFLLRVPASTDARDWRNVRWSDANGALLREDTVQCGRESRDEEMFAPAGRYTLEVTDARGNKTSATFDLRASDPPQVVELPL